MSVGWVGAAAAVGGALISADSARSAANSQADAAQRSSDATLQAQREANDLQKYMYDTTRSDNQTFLQNGTAASNELALRLGLVPSSSNNTAASNNTYSNPDQSEANFNVAAYLAANPDVAQNAYASQHAYQHYINNGKAEGRDFAYINAPQTAEQIASAQEAAKQAAQANPNYGSLMRSFTKEDLQNDVPYQQGFQYALDQGQLGVNRLAAASGSLNSGATLKALQDRAANVANQYAGAAADRFTTNQTNQYNRLAGLAGAGQTAASTLSSAGSNYANAGSNTALGTGNALSSIYTSAGNARGASAIAGGNSLNSGISSGLNFYNTNNLLSQLGNRNTNIYGSVSGGDLSSPAVGYRTSFL